MSKILRISAAGLAIVLCSANLASAAQSHSHIRSTDQRRHHPEHGFFVKAHSQHGYHAYARSR